MLKVRRQNVWANLNDKVTLCLKKPQRQCISIGCLQIPFSFLLVASETHSVPDVWNWVARCCLWPGFCQSRSMESPQSASRPTDLAFSFTFISARLALETFHSRTKSSSVWRSISAFCRSRFEHGLEIEIKKLPRQFNIKKRRLISGILLKKEKNGDNKNSFAFLR